MTESQPAAPEPSPESVRRSLRALANGSTSAAETTPADGSPPADESTSADGAASPHTSSGTGTAGRDADRLESDLGDGEGPVADAERTVDDAERAVSCARTAGDFLLGGGRAALDDAVATAARRGSPRLAQRGRRARAVLRDLDAALTGANDLREPRGDDSTPSPTGDATTSAPLAERF